jgi:hypothetical protein
VHGQYHRNMAPNPVFILAANDPLEFAVTLSRIARSGARLVLLLDGNAVLRRDFPSASADVASNEEFRIRIPAGRHRLEVRNEGLDWFQVRDYLVTNWVQRPVALVRGNTNRILIWIYDRLYDFARLDGYEQTAAIQATQLSLAGICEGEYRVEQFDPYLGTVEILPAIQAGGDGLKLELPSFRKDIAFRLLWQIPSAKTQRRK